VQEGEGGGGDLVHGLHVSRRGREGGREGGRGKYGLAVEMRHVIVRKPPANTLSPSLPPSISSSLSYRLGWTWVGIGLFVLAIAGMLHKGFPEMYKNKLKEKLVVTTLAQVSLKEGGREGGREGGGCLS